MYQELADSKYKQNRLLLIEYHHKHFLTGGKQYYLCASDRRNRRSSTYRYLDSRKEFFLFKFLIEENG